MNVRQIIETLCKVLEVVSEFTETTVDDKLHELLHLIKENEALMDWVENLANQKPDDNPDEVVFRAQSLPDIVPAGFLPMLLKLLPMIIQLIRAFR
jgi:hypothetical protein